MAGMVLRVPRESRVLLDIFSAARSGPPGSVRFTPTQVEQISRTVRRVPEVMVKVTGGATRTGAVSAHVSYISRKGQLEIETDDGDRIGRGEQRELIKSWHLELSPGQYRQAKDGASRPRELKLVHNIVLSMPRPTPPDKVLKAAKIFARERFGLQQSIRHGAAYAPGASPCPPGREGRGLRRPAPARQ